ncbi:hypothetical protein FB451DRAFT_1562736 [Mycena latifolia]|nr:hypothetical protein FB451DRAFT_1562736 [Mycena latifolia]
MPIRAEKGRQGLACATIVTMIVQSTIVTHADLRLSALAILLTIILFPDLVMAAATVTYLEHLDARAQSTRILRSAARRSHDMASSSTITTILHELYLLLAALIRDRRDGPVGDHDTPEAVQYPSSQQTKHHYERRSNYGSLGPALQSLKSPHTAIEFNDGLRDDSENPRHLSGSTTGLPNCTGVSSGVRDLAPWISGEHPDDADDDVDGMPDLV